MSFITIEDVDDSVLQLAASVECILIISRCVPVPRRHTPYFGQPDYRIYELNKRLQQRTEVSHIGVLLIAQSNVSNPTEKETEIAYCRSEHFSGRYYWTTTTVHLYKSVQIINTLILESLE